MTAAAAADVVLSDVHCDVLTKLCENVATSRFPFQLPFPYCSTKTIPDHDDDGDIVVERKQQYVFVIEHAMATPLDDVGQQVWHGALLLADLMLNMKDKISGAIVLELGGGVGLSSLAAALYAHTVICTDTGDKLLGLCNKNVQCNVDSLTTDVIPASVLVKSLNWLQPHPPQLQPHPPQLQPHPPQKECSYKWSDQDLTTLSITDVVIAADVIYDNDITDAFFSCLTHLYTEVFTKQPSLYIAVEKRINFTVEHLAAVSPAHQHFIQHFTHDHLSQSGHRIRFIANQMPVNDITQCFQYSRSEQMGVWQLQIIKLNNVDEGMGTM